METHTLNKKKIAVTIIIIVFLIIIIVSLFIFFHKEKNATEYTALQSTDGKFSIMMPNTISYQVNTNKDNDFTLDLYSSHDEMFMYATSINKLHEVDLHDIAEDDKTNYQKDKENIREDSGISEVSINNYKALQYNFIYYDKNYDKDFYCNVVWIETSNNIYVLNFEVVCENHDKYENIFSDIKNSFVEL